MVSCFIWLRLTELASPNEMDREYMYVCIYKWFKIYNYKLYILICSPCPHFPVVNGFNYRSTPIIISINFQLPGFIQPEMLLNAFFDAAWAFLLTSAWNSSTVFVQTWRFHIFHKLIGHTVNYISLLWVDEIYLWLVTAVPLHQPKIIQVIEKLAI